ncbi:MAG: carboxypeptidase-like regulatory domain-containing protein [Terriglobales bacterium]
MRPFQPWIFISQVAQSCIFLFASATVVAQTAQLPARTPGGFRIAGTIVGAGDGSPLSRARVSLQEVKNPQNAMFIITGENGRFEFANLRAGKYSLRGAKRGYITAAYDEHGQFSTAIVTGAGVDTENLTFRLVPTAVLTGHIFDESGEPVRNATVMLWRDDHSAGVGRTVRDRGAKSDDLGSFEFAPLNAGTYFVSVAANPWYAIHPHFVHAPGMRDFPTSVDHSVDVSYELTYYAGATEAEDATPILIRGGDHFDLDLHLTPVPALHVILRAPHEGIEQDRFPVFFKREFDGQVQIIQANVQMPSPGVFETAVAPGKYELQVTRRDNEPSQSIEVDISEEDQELDISAGQAASNISGKIELVGDTAFPPQMEFGLRNAQHRVVAWGAVTSNHEIAFADIAPGTYEVAVAGGPQAYSVASMTVNGSPVSGHSLTVPAGANLSLSLSVVGGVADVNGLAQRDGKGAAGAMIVLVPENPEANHELFRRDQSDLDGTFTLHSVIPGVYTAIAIEDGWDLDWSKTAVISRYTAHGQRLVVGNSATAIQIPNPLAVQPK